MSEELPTIQEEEQRSSIHIQQIPPKIIRQILHLTLKDPNSSLSARGVCSEWRDIINNNLNLTLIVEKYIDLINCRFNTCKTDFSIWELDSIDHFAIGSAIKTVNLTLKDLMVGGVSFQYLIDILNRIHGKTSNNCNLIISFDLQLNNYDYESVVPYLTKRSMRQEFNLFQLTSLNIYLPSDLQYDNTIVRYLLLDQLNLIKLYIRVWDHVTVVQLMTSGNIFNSVGNSLKVLCLDIAQKCCLTKADQQKIINGIIIKFPLLEEFTIEGINWNILASIPILSALNHLTKLIIDGYILTYQLIEKVKLSDKYSMSSLEEFAIEFKSGDGPFQAVAVPDKFMKLICIISLPNLTNFKLSLGGISFKISDLHELDLTQNGRKLLSVMKQLALTIPEFITENERNEYKVALQSILFKCNILETFDCEYIGGAFRLAIFDCILPESLTNYTVRSMQNDLISVSCNAEQPFNSEEMNELIQLINQLPNNRFKLTLTVVGRDIWDGDCVKNQLSDILQSNLKSITIRDRRTCDANWIILGKERQLCLTAFHFLF